MTAKPRGRIVDHFQTRPFLRFCADAAYACRPLSRVLRGQMGVSRSLLRRMRRSGYFKVDGAFGEHYHAVQAGQQVALYLPVDPDDTVTPEPVPIDVLFEDDHLLVLDKPPGLLTHPSGPFRSGTLANGVAHHLITQGKPNLAGPVTRLDRETSGLVLFAKHPHAHHRCSLALGKGTLQRTYIAFAEGIIPDAAGTIDAPIARLPGGFTRRTVNYEGQRAVTEFTAIRHFRRAPIVEAATLVQLKLLTGRTHQIRVHLAHIGHPVLGDEFYGRRIPGASERHALHARKLQIRHPIDDRVHTWKSPLPPDLKALWRVLDGA